MSNWHAVMFGVHGKIVGCRYMFVMNYDVKAVASIEAAMGLSEGSPGGPHSGVALLGVLLGDLSGVYFVAFKAVLH